MRITSILIGGVEMISICLKAATEINVESNGKMSTARLEAIFNSVAAPVPEGSKVGTAIVGTAKVAAELVGATLASQQTITIMGGETVLFSGYVARLTPQVVSPSLIKYLIECQDHGRILDRTMVASEVYTGQTEVAILTDLFATYLPEVTTVGVVGSDPPQVLDSITFENLSLRTCVERLCDRTGAEWRLGFDKDLKYFPKGTNVGAFSFSDSADGVATNYILLADFGYQEEFSQPANIVNVVGYQAPKPSPSSVILPVEAAVDDGFVYAYSTVYWPPTENLTVDVSGAAIMLYSSYSGGIGGTYTFSNGFIRFSTSSIPAGAVILSAVLKLYGVATGGIYNRAIGVDYFNASNWPIGEEDYSADCAFSQTHVPTAMNWRDLAPLNLGGMGSVPTLLELSLENIENIIIPGYVGLRVYVGLDTNFVNDSFQVQVESVASTVARYRPTLTITYQEPQPASIKGYAEDVASIALYGSLAKTITDAAIKTVGEADARAAVEITRYSYPRKSINCSFDRDGLNVGDTVQFTSSLLGIDDAYTIKKLRIRWVGTQSQPRYYAELGEARGDLIEILRKGI